ncbi:hypothetical protein E8E15_010375 [Penicillium rubens]|jgi:hypothetical protein|uniref:Pc12g12660 protein n=2 Tax=Penicillium chrysogenum species complex TaxID=254878 RepID=B6GYY9_PENRW|nr:uncharacterized protein N7525_001325 [Penicillium rubens]KAF3025431.1 hypothetical protein E8E15_010375 [Penicillium rubens]KAJ5843584.1 hypothetical protein N7525_001325 [Penicillium rubens]KZN85426.1 hypothetical protein EN45_096060 [Penicillium chrysogenum]CAP80893.1 Pc12g12660 [Penicillium rubens Wisconsin 54-1255]
MPKKHQRFHTKPASLAHHSLASSGSRQDGGSGLQSSASTTSVNDLISHLRRTQIPNASSDDPPSSQRTQRSFVAQRSVHPSLRDVLELPETAPPRPRPGPRRTIFGVRPSRPTVGPPPPASWLSQNTNRAGDQGLRARIPGAPEEEIHRLARLQGPLFPDQRSLVHLLLKSMALNWCWHVEYDGPFLSHLPNHIKELLLSYVAVYARGTPLRGYMKGLKPLFLAPQDQDQIGKEIPGFNESRAVDGDFKIVRLDLGNALGNWITLKQLTNEVILSPPPAVGVSDNKIEEAVPASWDEAVDNGGGEAMLDHLPAPSMPKAITQALRFPELRALSLAHPKPSAASWTGLLDLLAHLPTLTHLSLAHWPIPCRNPRTATTRIRGQEDRFLTPDAVDNNWAEVASILRQLSRSTYCLKWLDLEGCGEWLPALKWVGKDPDGFPQSPDSVGPEWNGSWRDVEWLGIGPGFRDLTKSDDSSHVPSHEVAAQETGPPDSIHAYHLQNARDVMRHIRQIRKGRKWLEIELGLGLEDVEPEIIRSQDGQELSVYL